MLGFEDWTTLEPAAGGTSAGGAGQGGRDGSAGTSDAAPGDAGGATAGDAATDGGPDVAAGGQAGADGGPDAATCSPACGLGQRCVGGVCSPCGNSAVDAPEECDDGNDVDGDGCDNDCRFSCVPTDPSRDCSSTDPCVTSGICSTSTHRCSAKQPRPNGTPCSDADTPTGNCIAGGCVPAVCGDGYLAQSLETCDDGNLIQRDGCKSDCTYTCTTGSDCPRGFPTPSDPLLLRVPACNQPVCDLGHFCRYEADPARTGLVCNTTGGSGTCSSGDPSACTSGVCGNGTRETGEECDLGVQNGTPGAGCERTCQFSCITDLDCDDGDACNGTETCVASGIPNVSRHCERSGTTLEDGTACEVGRICRNGGCARSICGDGLTDTQAGEQCEPPNTVGCSSTCQALITCSDAGGLDMAVHMRLPMTWASPAIETGQGDVVLLGYLHAVRSNAGEFPARYMVDARFCGLTMPDFYSLDDPALEPYRHERFGLEFPDAVFDSATRTFPSTATLSSLTPGSTVDLSSISALMGITMDDPLGVWPPSNGTLIDGNPSPAEQEDYDNDGFPAVTVKSKSVDDPANYSAPIVNVSGFLADGAPPGRADVAYLAMRSAIDGTGVVESCDQISGLVNVLYINTHVIGCRRAAPESAVCTPSEVAILDAVSPQYTPIGSATFVFRRLASPLPSNPCVAVRQEFATAPP